MGYISTKFKLYFKTYDSKVDANLLKLSKEEYNNNSEEINNKVRNCKTSLLKVILFILLFIYVIKSIYDILLLTNSYSSFYVFIESHKPLGIIGIFGFVLSYYMQFFLPILLIFYVISLNNKTIRESRSLSVFAIISILTAIIYFSFFYFLL